MGTTGQGKEKKGLSQAGVRLGKPKYLVSSGGCGGGLWWAWGGVGCGGVGWGLNPWRVPPPPTLGSAILKAVVLGSQLLG